MNKQLRGVDRIMKTKYTGMRSYIEGVIAEGSLLQIMKNEDVHIICKNDNYIIYKHDKNTWSPSLVDNYKPTKYEKKCMKEYELSMAK